MTEHEAKSLLRHISEVARIMGVSERWLLQHYADQETRTLVREARKVVREGA